MIATPLRHGVCVFAAAILLVQSLGCSERREAALGTLEWDRVNGRAVVSEPIIEIFVREGDRVEAGAPLLRLDPRLQEARVAQSRGQVSQAEARLAERKRGFREEEVAKARAELEAARINLATAKLELEREQALLEQDVVSARQLDAYENRMAQAEAREERAVEQLTLLTAGFRIEEIEQAAAQLAAAMAELAYEEAELARYTVQAERAGLVDSLPFKIGDKPPAQAVVTTVLAGDRPWARVYLPEPWLSKINVGDRVDVRVDGRAQPYVGRVRHIESSPAYTPYYALSEEDRTRLSYVTQVDLIEESALELRVGIPVRVLPSSD